MRPVGVVTGWLAAGLGCAGLAGRPPVGPPVTERVSLPAAPEQWVTAGEAFVLRLDDRLVGVVPGTPGWTRVEPFAPWVAPAPGDAVVTATDAGVLFLDPATGRTRATNPFPPPPPPDEDGFTDHVPPRIRAGAAVDGAVVAVDTEARFWRATGVDGAVAELLFQLPDEAVSDSTLGWDRVTRTFLFEESGLVRRLDADGTVRFAAHSHDAASVDGSVPLEGGATATIVDGDVMVLERGCTGDFAPSGWPHPGELFVRDLDEAPDLGRAPRGCLRWLRYEEDIVTEPLLAHGDDVIGHAGDATVAWRDGARRWERETGGTGSVRPGPDGLLLTVSAGLSDGDPWTLLALDPADGALRWATPLGTESPFVHSTDEVVLAVAGRRALAGYGRELAVVGL